MKLIIFSDEINTTTLFNFWFSQLFLLIAIGTKFCKIFAFLGQFTFRTFDKKNKTKTKRFSSNCSKQICRGIATPKIIQRFYQFRSCKNNTALELEQVTHHIFGRKKLKNYLMCKSNVIRTLHLFYRHNAT